MISSPPQVHIPSSFLDTIFCPLDPTPFAKQAKQIVVSCTVNGSCHLPSGVLWEDAAKHSLVDRLHFMFQEKQVARWGVRAGCEDL